MAALWDRSTGTFFPGQDWAHPPEPDGKIPSCWDPAVEEEAKICLRGLRNMLSYYTGSQSSVSGVPWGDLFHFRMSVMMQWCQRVVDGRMPHGALLAHTRLTGQIVVQGQGYTVPGPNVDWQQHGQVGVAAIRAFLLSLGFYPQMVESVHGRAPPAVPSLAERNRHKKEQGFPSVEWTKLTLIRGVELWIDDEGMLQNHTWDMVPGGLVVSEVQCPVSPGNLLPGEYNITYFQQIKGHWFWAMYKDEATGQLTVKWVRGKCPPGGKRWP